MLLLWLQATLSFGQINPDQVHAIDTTQTLEASFAFIGNEIGNTRVVALGEQTHTPDASFKVRAKLIEYLIEYKGFEVVLFEAGMFDLHVANKLATQTQAVDSLKKGLYSFWGKAPQHKRLFEYLGATINNGHKALTFAGFDCKLTSAYSRKDGQYLQALTRELKAINTPDVAEASATYLAIWAKIDADMKRGGLKSVAYKMKDKEKQRFLELSKQFQEVLTKTGNTYWAQIIRMVDESVVLYADFSMGKALTNKQFMLALNNKRDSLMAQNLDYLLHEVYKDKKVILFGATYHFARNVSLMQPKKVMGLDLSKSVTSGQILHNAGKEKIFVIGFTAPEPLKCNSKSLDTGSKLNCIQNTLGYNIAYFPLHQWNLQTAPADVQPIIKIVHPNSQTRHPDWNAVLDAVVLIQNTQ